MAAVGFALGQHALAQEKEYIPLKHGAHRIGPRTDVEMQRWREHGLGQFIHWGVYAIPGGQWEGKVFNGAAEWIRVWKEFPKDAYDNLYKQFNPLQFDATQWARMAKDMGAKYMIITTKHHDGFCIWPSKYTDYTVRNAPYKKDILKEIVDAYTKEGIDVHLYFSVIDWNHPGYRSAAPVTKEDSAAYKGFLAFTRNQLIELLTDYPSAKGLWFDGTWDKAWVNESKFCDDLETELRALSPGVIIGSRFRADELGNRHFDANGNLIGDYNQLWERKFPASVGVLNGDDWDCVMTIPHNNWGYCADWSQFYIKTPYELIAMMLKSVSMNGNFVLNFGPDGNGAFRPEERRIAQEIGKWMKENSAAVYGCIYSGLENPDWGYYTRKGNKIYMTVFNRPLNHILRLQLPPELKIKPLAASMLATGQPVDLRYIRLGLDKDKNVYYEAVIPKDFSSEMPFVIVLDIEQEKQEKSGKEDDAHT